MTLRRASAAALALILLAALVTRIWLNMGANNHSLPEAIWAIYRYFTLWTNTLVAGVGLALLFGRQVDQHIIAGLVLAFTAVGIVYHVLLASENDYSGVDLLIDQVFHTIGPIWFALHWLAFEPKSRLSWRDLPLWLAYPAIYCAVALIRGAFEDRYPYFFLDISTLGALGTLIWVLAMLAAFAVVGVVILLIARLSTRKLRMA